MHQMYERILYNEVRIKAEEVIAVGCLVTMKKKTEHTGPWRLLLKQTAIRSSGTDFPLRRFLKSSNFRGYIIYKSPSNEM